MELIKRPTIRGCILHIRLDNVGNKVGAYYLLYLVSRRCEPYKNFKGLDSNNSSHEWGFVSGMLSSSHEWTVIKPSPQSLFGAANVRLSDFFHITSTFLRCIRAKLENFSRLFSTCIIFHANLGRSYFQDPFITAGIFNLTVCPRILFFEWYYLSRFLLFSNAGIML